MYILKIFVAIEILLSKNAYCKCNCGFLIIVK